MEKSIVKKISFWYEKSTTMKIHHAVLEKSDTNLFFLKMLRRRIKRV